MSSDKPCCPCPIEKVAKALRLPKPPFFILAVPAIGTCVLALVGAHILYSKYAFSAEPRLALVQDMGNQPKFRAQAPSVMFVDGRTMRAPVPGTVAYANFKNTPGAEGSAQCLKNDDHYFRGYETDEKGAVKLHEVAGKQVPVFIAGYPKDLVVDAALMHVGREKYAQNCAMCHGLDAQGKGPVDAVASRLMTEGTTQTTWASPANLTVPKYFTAAGYENGELFHVINHGRGNMAGLGSMLSERDAWAIVAYVRALQRSQNANGK